MIAFESLQILFKEKSVFESILTAVQYLELYLESESCVFSE